MIVKIANILLRVYRMGQRGEEFPAPAWEDEEYLRHCEPTDQADRMASFFTDLAEEIAQMFMPTK